MPGYTIINFPAESSNQDVQIAGNFTNWQPQVMQYNDSVSRFEYKVNDLVDGSTTGKYNFKFIINGEWRVDKEYPSEFDPSGNENNVILYDYTDDKSASDEYISKLKTEVTQDNEEGPKTPDPTPYNLSTTPTNVQTNSTSDATTATAIATGILPVTEPPTESKTLPAHDKESTLASKAVPKTEPTNGSSQFIPLTETSTEQAPKNESLSIPEPEPVKRAEPPTKTKAPEPQSGNKKTSELKADGKPSAPKPVDRPEPPKQTGAPKTIPIIPESSLPITTNTEKKSKDDSTSNTNSKTLKPSPSPAQDQPFSDTNEGGEGYEDASNQLQEHRPASNPYSNSGKDIPQYSIGFFATMLHVITQFFRRWFHLNSE